LKTVLSTFRRLQQCDTGSVAVEFAMIGTVLITLIAGLIEFGRGLSLYNRISFAVDQAARVALTQLKPNDDSTNGDDLMKGEIQKVFQGVTPAPTITIEDGTSGSGANLVNFKTITVSSPFNPIVPGFISPTITLKTVRRVPVLP
jgi:Flp pilus assembly protein TadG